MSEGFNCATCGKHYEFPAYVYAHSSDVLVHTCVVCNAKHEILNLSAKQIRPGTKPTKEATA